MRQMKWLAWTIVAACGGVGDATIDGGNDSGQSVDSGADTSTSDAGNPNDSGTTTDTGTTDGGGFNVGAVNGLVLWLEGDLSSSITLSPADAGAPTIIAWADQTSHHNDAKGVTASTSLTRNPTVKTAGINGKDVVHFDEGTGNVGNMLTIVDNQDASLQWGTGDFYLVVVADFDNDPKTGGSTAAGNFFSKAFTSSGGNTPPTGVALYGNIPAGANTLASTGLFAMTQLSANNFLSTATAYNTGAAHLFGFRRQANKLDLFVDGTSVANTTSTGVDVSTAQTIVRIGADGDATLLRLDGDIAEMIAVKGALAAGDQLGIESYLKTKWATP